MRISQRHTNVIPLFSTVGEGRGSRFNRGELAFTLIEIAISLAVVGFALAAIIGILPTGLNVQKQNREETIINQDKTVIMDAIRNGERGLDDLTNYITTITRYITYFDGPGRPPGAGHTDLYTPTNSYRDSNLMSPPYPIINGFRIVGLLSTPKYVPVEFNLNPPQSGFYSNYVVATVRAISGPAGEKYPQTNSSIQDLAFSYRLVVDVVPYNAFDQQWVNFAQYATNTPEYRAAKDYSLIASNMEVSLHDVRLIFRWPLLPNGTAGNSRQVFRSLAGGRVYQTNEAQYANGGFITYRLFFFEPRNYEAFNRAPLL